MVVVTGKKRWETKPLACWGKFKEATKTNYRDMGKKGGKELLCLGAGVIGAGFQARVVGGHPYAAQIAGAGLSAEFVEAAEARGYSRDLCAYARVDLGSSLLHKWAFGNVFPEPEFVLGPGGACDAQRVQMLPLGEHHKLPMYHCDNLQIYEFDSEQTRRNKDEYGVAQALEAIEWLEKLTGREFDDEAFIEDLYIDARSTNLRSQVLLMNQYIPAPLDEKTMFSVVVARGGREGVSLMQELRDEVEDRVRHQIAAVGTERYRVMTFGIPPWHSLNIFRYMEQYGVVSIGSRYTFNNAAGTTLTAEGIEIPVPNLEQRGIILRTREEAVRVALERIVDRPSWQHRTCGRAGRENQLRMARLWHCDGLVMHQNHGCWGATMSASQVKLAFQENNIPVVVYEGSHADERDWNEFRVLARLDAFFESQGLEKLV